MKQVWRKISLFLVVQVMMLYVWDNPMMIAASSQKENKIQYSGVLLRNQNNCNDSFLVTLSFPCNTNVKVTLELDSEQCRAESGGHIQFAFTKDEAHSLWADDIALYPDNMSSYTESFSLYAGTYVFELHLIRDEEYAHIPWHVTLETEENTELPANDSDATCWFMGDWTNKTVKLGKQKKTIDLYRKLMISSWTEIRPNQIVYSTSNKKIASVSKRGKLTIKKPGKVAVTVKLPNGYRETIIVKI